MTHPEDAPKGMFTDIIERVGQRIADMTADVWDELQDEYPDDASYALAIAVGTIAGYARQLEHSIDVDNLFQTIAQDVAERVVAHQSDTEVHHENYTVPAPASASYARLGFKVDPRPHVKYRE